jgi:hypothetical protein
MRVFNLVLWSLIDADRAANRADREHTGATPQYPLTAIEYTAHSRQCADNTTTSAVDADLRFAPWGKNNIHSTVVGLEASGISISDHSAKVDIPNDVCAGDISAQIRKTDIIRLSQGVNFPLTVTYLYRSAATFGS